MLNEIRKANPGIKIIDINDTSFNGYGRILDGFDFTSIIDYAEKNVKIPAKGNEYLPSVKEIEVFPVVQDIREDVYGQMPIEAGTCAGQNTLFTGLEYHQGSETIIAVKDCLLFLGKLQDMVDGTYTAAKAEAFYLPRGIAVELYSTTLHYTPCKVMEEGFMTLVILPEGSNFPLDKVDPSVKKNKLLVKKNKFLIIHASQKVKIEDGVFPGLVGELIEIRLGK